MEERRIDGREGVTHYPNKQRKKRKEKGWDALDENTHLVQPLFGRLVLRSLLCPALPAPQRLAINEHLCKPHWCGLPALKQQTGLCLLAAGSTRVRRSVTGSSLRETRIPTRKNPLHLFTLDILVEQRQMTRCRTRGREICEHMARREEPRVRRWGEDVNAVPGAGDGDGSCRLHQECE